MKGSRGAARPGEGWGQEEKGPWPHSPHICGRQPPPPPPGLQLVKVSTPVSPISEKFSSALRTRGLGRAGHRRGGGWRGARGCGRPGARVPRGVGSPAGLPPAEGALAKEGGRARSPPGSGQRRSSEGREAAPGPSPQSGGRWRMRGAGGGDGPALHAGAGERQRRWRREGRGRRW